MSHKIRITLRATGLVAVILIVALVLAAATTRASSPVPQDGATVVLEAPAVTGPLLNYQGRLTDPTTGAPKSGTFAMTFRLYGVASGGSDLWTETKNVVATNGLFSTVLGDDMALNLTVFDGRDLWLGVQVGHDPEATPRVQIAYAPYALYTSNAAKLGGQLPSAFAVAGHQHNAADITAGTLSYAQFSAYGDLQNDARIGTGAVQVAAGDHTHQGATIVDGSIATADLADGSVTSAKIADGGVANADLAANSVDGAKIVDLSITKADLANSSVTSAQILDGGVATADLADGSVNSAKIADLGVNTADLADSSVTSAKIADSAIGSADISDRTLKIGFPANALNHQTGGYISQNGSSGLLWQSNYGEGAGLAIPRPSDWDGVSDVSFRLWFYPTTNTAGYVQFFIRPRAWNDGSSVGDVTAIAATPLYVTNDHLVLQQQIISIPATTLDDGILWYITIQRQGSSETYQDNVVLMSVELDYSAVR